MNDIKKNRQVLFFIFGIPVVVLLFSTALYFLADAKMVELGTSNKGMLITPPVQLKSLQLSGGNGTSFDYEKPEPLWTFLIIGDNQCEVSCEKLLYLTRQTHKSSKYYNQIRHIYLNVDAKNGNALNQLLTEEYPLVQTVFTDRTSAEKLLADLPVDPFQNTIFYLVDPHGWIMMYYRIDDFEISTLSALSKDILKDMKRLLQ